MVGGTKGLLDHPPGYATILTYYCHSVYSIYSVKIDILILLFGNVKIRLFHKILSKNYFKR